MSWFRLDCRFRIGPPGVRPLDSLLWFGVLDLGASFLCFTLSSCVYDLSSVSVVVSSPLDVTSETSRMIRSNSAVSSACFWLWRAIFSLNFRGLAIVVDWFIWVLLWGKNFLLSLAVGRNFHTYPNSKSTVHFNHFPLFSCNAYDDDF